jgi:putative sigma-54 modulation protein
MMDVTIRGHNLKVTDVLESYTRKRLDKLDRYLPNIRDIRVDFSRQNTARGENLSIAQITLRHGRGAILRAEEKLASNEHDSMQTALNIAVDKMYRQIERFKGKRTDRKRRGRYAATAEELSVAEETPALEDYEEAGAEEIVYEEETEIVRRKEIEVIAMNESEAIEQMELLGHNFFMFFNDATESINVLYKRTDGGYGLLNPQK